MEVPKYNAPELGWWEKENLEERGKQELMNPQTTVYVCSSSSSSCAVAGIYQAKQTAKING